MRFPYIQIKLDFLPSNALCLGRSSAVFLHHSLSVFPAGTATRIALKGLRKTSQGVCPLPESGDQEFGGSAGENGDSCIMSYIELKWVIGKGPDAGEN